MGSMESNDFALEDYINSTNKIISNYETKLKKFHTYWYVCNTENKQLEKQKQRLSDKLERYEKNIEEMSISNIANQNKMLELKESCQKLIDEIKNINNEKNKLSELNIKLQNQINNITEENEDQKKINAELNSKLHNESNLENEIKKLQNQVSELTIELNKKNSEEVNSNLPNEEFLKEDNRQLTEQNKKLQDQINELTIKLNRIPEGCGPALGVRGKKNSNKKDKPVVNVELVEEETGKEESVPCLRSSRLEKSQGDFSQQTGGKPKLKKAYATKENLKTLLTAKTAGENEHIAKQIKVNPLIQNGKKKYTKKYVIETIMKSSKFRKSAIEFLNNNHQEANS